MKRREFIGMAAAGAAGLVLAPSLPAASVEVQLARPRLLAVLRDEQLLREIGKRYRQIVPAENDSASLTQALLREAPALESARLQAHVAARVQTDFAEGRTVTLNGWVLAVTEARQCALMSLQPA